MADIEYVNGTDGSDNLNGGPGENVYTGGRGDDQISGIDGVNTINFGRGDGVDAVSFAPPRTYQFARFLSEAQAALAELSGVADSATFTSEYFGKFASTRLIDEELPPEIRDVLRQLRVSFLGEGGGEVLGSVTAGAARDAFNALVGWINTPNTNLVQFGEGISAADLKLQMGSTALWGGPAEFAVAVSGDEGLVFRLGRADVVAGDSSVPPTLDITFRFADGSSITAAELLAQPPAGIMGYQFDSDEAAFLRGSIASDTLYANGGDDQVDAGGGYDSVSGGIGNDAISGGFAYDTLHGEDGDDVIAAGRDGGLVIGGAGNDTYAYNLGDGPVRIDDMGIAGEVDTLSFGKDVDPSTVTAYADPGGGSLTIMTGHADDYIVVDWFDPSNDNAERPDTAIERVQFIDAAGNVRVFDLAALIRARTADLMVATEEAPVTLFDGAGVAFEISGATGAGGEYASNYARTGDMFTASADGNVAPVAGPAIGEQTAREDQAFSFALPAGAFSDADGDALTFSATTPGGQPLPAWLSIDAITGTLSGTPGNGDVGAVSVIVTATDPAGEHATQVFSIGVLNENDAPVLAHALADQVLNEGSGMTFMLPADAFADVDVGDLLTLSTRQGNGDALPAWLSFDAATRTFTAAPGMGDVGSVNVRVTATDRSGATSSDVFAVDVLDVNETPIVANPIADQSASEDAAFTFTLPADTFVDPDMGGASSPAARVEALSLSASLVDGTALPSWLSFDAATRTFRGTPGNSHVGMLDVRVTATDTGGMVVADEFRLSVANVNDAPELVAPLADLRAEAGQAFRATLPESAFRDADAGDTLVWTAKQADGGDLPSWLTFDPGTRTFQGTPPAVTLGRMDVRVSVTDPGNVQAFDDFTLDVVAGGTGTTLRGRSGDDTLTGGEGNDTLNGRGGKDLLYGNGGDDRLAFHADGEWGRRDYRWNQGSPGYAGSSERVRIAGMGRSRDLFNGGSGHDTLVGTSGDDAILLDDSRSPAAASGPRLVDIERISAGAGDDVVDLTSRRYAYGDVTIDGGSGDDVLWSSSGHDVLSGAAGDDRLDGGMGNDYLNGGRDDDYLRGRAGVDVLQGGKGNDALLDCSGQAVMDGGAGADTLINGGSSTMLIGGRGDDRITLGGGNDVVAYNKGDGRDTVFSGKGGAATLSLGTGIELTDLRLRKVGDDLVLEIGRKESITFDDWYDGSRFQAVSKVQFVAEGMPGYGGDNPLLDDKIETFDFKGIAGAFDRARGSNPGLSTWALTEALTTFHLGGNESAALGGDLAYQYGVNGLLAGVGLGAAQDVSGSSEFGRQAQVLRAREELTAGAVRLA